MRADQQRLAWITRAADYVADAVDSCFKTSACVLVFEPAPRFHIRRAERWSDYAATLCANRAQPLQIGEQTFSVDARHRPGIL